MRIVVPLYTGQYNCFTGELMTIPLKNPNVYSRTFSCICAQCRTEFVIVVAPTSIGKAICPNCESEKIFVQSDNKNDLDLLDY